MHSRDASILNLCLYRTANSREFLLLFLFGTHRISEFKLFSDSYFQLVSNFTVDKNKSINNKTYSAKVNEKVWDFSTHEFEIQKMIT